MRNHFPWQARRPRWILVLAAAVLAAGALPPPAARAGEIIPSLGITRDVNGSDAARLSTGLALRDPLGPMFEGEIAVSYRTESRYNDQLKLRSWPITASLYVKPVPVVYAGAGVGWYQTTYDYPSTSLFQDQTKQQFGVHLGGGFQVPVGGAALDLGGRYVMLRDQESQLVPQKFNPDYWTTSLGLAFKF